MGYFFLSILYGIDFILICLVMLPITFITRIVTNYFDRKLIAVHFLSCIWGSLLSLINPLWTVKIIGREKLKSSQPLVLISNHQSMLDILVLYRLFVHFKWISKIELFKVPIVGWNMSLNKYVPVDRASRKGHLRMMNESENNLRNGSSLMIFPEGTRSDDGEIHAFKEGAFRLAQTAKVSIVPIIIDGTRYGFPKKGMIFDHKCRVVIKVLDKIPYNEFANLTSREVAEQVRMIMIKELNALREQMAS